MYEVILAGAQTAGKWQATVHSVFANAVNLIVNEKRFTLLFNPLWISEHNIIISDNYFASLINRSSRLSSDEQFIYIDDAPYATYKNSLQWQMPEIIYSPIQPSHLQELEIFLKQNESNPLVNHIEKQFIETISYFFRNDCADFSKIVGAGPGLTPSGDDMLVGLALAIQFYSPKLLPRLSNCCVSLLDNTTDISKYLLSDALSGKFTYPLINLLMAITQGENIDDAIATAANIGSSSGRDGIFGLYQGIKLLENINSV